MTENLEALLRSYAEEDDPEAFSQLVLVLEPLLSRWARGLVPDTSAQSEVVQEVLCVLLFKAKRIDLDRPLLPWLRGVLTRAVYEARREAARGPGGDSDRRMISDRIVDAAKEAEANETLSLVRDNIEKLPDSLRQIVALVVLADMKPREIARQLDLDPGSVRVRLHRGLCLLRKRVRSTLATGLAWLGVRRAAALTSIAAGGGLSLWTILRAPPPSPLAADHQHAPREVSRLDGSIEVVRAFDLGERRLRVVDGLTGHPLAGARVVIGDVGERRTDPAGEARLLIERNGVLDLMVRHPGFSDQPVLGISAGLETDPVLVVSLRPAGRAISGRLRDESGRPLLERCALFLFRQTGFGPTPARDSPVAWSDEEGRFRLSERLTDSRSADDILSLAAGTSRGLAWSHGFRALGRGEASRDVMLLPSTRIRARVLSAGTGAALPGAQVSLIPCLSQWPAGEEDASHWPVGVLDSTLGSTLVRPTDPSGLVEFHCPLRVDGEIRSVPNPLSRLATLPVKFRARRPGWVTESLTLDLADRLFRESCHEAPIADLEAIDAQEHPLSGVVTDEAGTPLAGASIELVSGWQPVGATTSDEAGAWTLTPDRAVVLPATLRVGASGRQPITAEILDLERWLARPGSDVVLHRSVDVRGQVVDPQGNPVRDAVIRVETGVSGTLSWDELQQLSTDDEAPDLVEEPVWTPVDRRAMRMVLDSLTRTQVTASTGADGWFSIPADPRTELSLIVEPPAGGDWEGGALWSGRPDDLVRVTLDRAVGFGSLTATLCDIDGQDLVPRWVGAYRCHAPPNPADGAEPTPPSDPILLLGTMHREPVRRLEPGWLEFEQLLPGNWLLIVDVHDHATVLERVTIEEPGHSVHLDLISPEPAAVSLVLQAEEPGGPLPETLALHLLPPLECMLPMWPDGSRLQQVLRVPARGRVEATNLTPGQWLLFCEDRAYEVWPQVVEIEAGSNPQQVIEVRRRSARDDGPPQDR